MMDVHSNDHPKRNKLNSGSLKENGTSPMVSVGLFRFFREGIKGNDI
jgi:hypothetical protein